MKKFGTLLALAALIGFADQAQAFGRHCRKHRVSSSSCQSAQTVSSCGNQTAPTQTVSAPVQQASYVQTVAVPVINFNSGSTGGCVNGVCPIRR